MPPKRKRDDNSDEELQRDTKRPKTEQMTCLTLDSLPDDCLCEIFCHLPRVSICSALLASKRFEAFLLKVLSKTNLSSDIKGNISRMPQAIKQQMLEIFLPKTPWFVRQSWIASDSDNEAERREKQNQLRLLHNWSVTRLHQHRNVQRLKTESPELWSHVVGRYAFKEFSNVSTFSLWDGTTSGVEGGTFHVSFFLFGQKGQFIKVNCNVLSYQERERYAHYACKLEFTAQLYSCSSSEREEVSDLLQGYRESNVPDNYKKMHRLDEDKESKAFQEDLDKGDRIECKWYDICYPKLNKEMLNRVIEWLGWSVSTMEFAKILVGLTRSPSIKDEKFYDTYRAEVEDYGNDDDQEEDSSKEVKVTNIDTCDTKATFEQLSHLILHEGDDQFLVEVEQTLALLEAKIMLKNRILSEWKEKDSTKMTQLTALVDRSMYTDWIHTDCTFTPHSKRLYNYSRDYHKVIGEIKLIAEDPSKWVSLKFNTDVLLDEHFLDSSYHFVLATTTEELERPFFEWEDWLSPNHAELFQNQLGLQNFTVEELQELINYIADVKDVPPHLYK